MHTPPKAGITLVIGAGKPEGEKPEGEESSAETGAFVPSSMLGEHADKFEEGATGTITFKYKVSSKSEDGVELDFTSVESCEGGESDEEPEGESDDMEKAFGKFKKEAKDGDEEKPEDGAY
jgi:hypothetical protein